VDEGILDQTAKLSDEELRRSDATDFGSAFDTLLHMVIVGWSWREFCIATTMTTTGRRAGRSPTSPPSAGSGTRSTPGCSHTPHRSTRPR